VKTICWQKKNEIKFYKEQWNIFWVRNKNRTMVQNDAVMVVHFINNKLTLLNFYLLSSNTTD
jgi:hypothetical protein